MSSGYFGSDFSSLISFRHNSKLLPTYSSALARSEDELFYSEDLDKVQVEFEQLLSKVALRCRALQCDYDYFEKDEKRIERRTKYAEKKPSSPGKKKREDFRKSKTFFSKKQLKHKSSPTSIFAQCQSSDCPAGTSHIVSQYSSEQRFVMPKNDIPNKFWLSVEPYCMPITNEDIRLVDDLIDQYCGPLVPPMPDLGTHYTTTWAIDDLADLRHISQAWQSNATLQNLKRPRANSNAYITGPITNRLVSAFIDEGLGREFLHLRNCDGNKSLSFLKNATNVEKGLENELIAQGLFESKECSNNDKDEVIDEIKKLISEISSVSMYNVNTLKRLRETCGQEIATFGVKRNLDIVDHEILEAYKRIGLLKSKIKVINIEEQQGIYRIISEQKALSDKIGTTFR